MKKKPTARRASSKFGRPPAHEVASREAKLLDTATEAFLEAGFTGTKMSVIAKKAGASMETLYALYPTKSELFAALIERKASGLFKAVGILSPDRQPREALTTYAVELVAMMTNPDTQALHRLVIAGSLDSPELGAMFWEAGPGRGFKIIRTYLNDQKSLGVIPVKDVDRATGLLMGMLVGGIVLRSTLGLRGMPQSQEEQRNWAEYVVDLFLRGLN